MREWLIDLLDEHALFIILLFVGIALAISLTYADHVKKKEYKVISTDGMVVARELPDGRTVICVGNASTGLSCDWDHAYVNAEREAR